MRHALGDILYQTCITECALECEAGEFSAEAGERQVTFSWCSPDDDSNCSIYTPEFQLSCSPSFPSVLTALIHEQDSQTLPGFFPNTHYNCSVARDGRSLAITSFTTKEDCTYFAYAYCSFIFYTISQIPS